MKTHKEGVNSQERGCRKSTVCRQQEQKIPMRDTGNEPSEAERRTGCLRASRKKEWSVTSNAREDREMRPPVLPREREGGLVSAGWWGPEQPWRRCRMGYVIPSSPHLHTKPCISPVPLSSPMASLSTLLPVLPISRWPCQPTSGLLDGMAGSPPQGRKMGGPPGGCCPSAGQDPSGCPALP